MKKRVLVLLTIGVLSIFTACKSEETQDTKEPGTTKEPEIETTVTPTQKPEVTTKPDDTQAEVEDAGKPADLKPDTEASKAIREVLLGEREFISTDEDNEKTTISDFDYYYGDKVEKTYWGDFLVVDFDGDGNLEAVVEVHEVEDSPMPQMEILHYEDGVVYGYQVVAKGMREPNTDGMFMVTSDYSNYARLEFDKDKCTYIHYVEKGSEIEQFYLSLSEEQQKDYRLEYVEDKMYEEYYSFSEVRYYEFTKANIEMYVRPASFNIEVEQIGEEETIEWNITVKRIADGFTQKIHMNRDENCSLLPSKNNMVRVEDVNFDGYDDIIIHKGNFGAQGASGYEAYIWDESYKELIHEESFLEIPNHEIDYERKLITGSVRQSSIEHDELVYRFQNGEFVNVATLSMRFEEEDDVHVSVQKNEDGKLSEKVYGAVSYERYKEIYEQMLDSAK